MSSKNELIRLYSQNEVAHIGQDPQYRRLCELHGNNISFQKDREKVANAKFQLEKSVGGEWTNREQVRHALIALRKERGPEQAMFRALIVASYRPAWTPYQQAYFDMAAEKLGKKFDFFLSFTDRHGHDDEVNPINQSYKQLIQEILAPNRIRQSDSSKENLLARACFYRIATPPRTGFHFPKDQYDNTLTIDKLRQALSDSFVFLQLVQNVMFVTPTGPQENYCFLEYDENLRLLQGDPHLEDRILFAVCEESREALIDQVLVPFDYINWHNHILLKDPPYFRSVRNFGPTAVRSLLTLIDQRLGRTIDAAWTKLIDGAPTD